MPQTNLFNYCNGAASFAKAKGTDEAGNYTLSKKKQLLRKYTPATQCVVSDFNKSDFNKSQLYMNLYTSLNLIDVPVICDLSGNTVPVSIDTTVQPYLKYMIDPSGALFGNSVCGIDNYLHYVTFASHKQPTYYSLGSGINTGGVVTCLAFDNNNNLYVGGLFSSAGGISATNIATYNTTTLQWSALGSGVNGQVYSIAVDSENNVYVGGQFSNVGPNIAKWSDGIWSSIGNPSPSITPPIYCITFDYSGNLWTGSTGNTSYDSLAKYIPSTNTWSWVGQISHNINSIAFDSFNNLYIAGSGAVYNGNKIIAYNVAKMSPSGTWVSLGSPGLNNYGISVKIDSNDDAIITGGFTTAAVTSSNKIVANNIVKWNNATSTYSAFGSGFTDFHNTNLYPNSLYVDTQDNVFVSGQFSSVDDISANNIAIWNTSLNSWNALGNGITGTGGSLTGTSTGSIYIGGSFTNAGHIYANNIAKYS